MAVARMKRVTILGHRSVLNSVVSTLQDMGCLQVINLKESLSPEELEAFTGISPRAADAPAGAPADAPAGDVEERLARVSHCISYLGRFETRQKGLIESFMGQKERVPASRLDHTIREFDEGPVYEACLSDEQAAIESRTERARIESQIALLSEWTGLDLPVEELGEHPGVSVVAASASKADYQRLESDFEHEPVHLEKAGESSGTVRFVAYYRLAADAVTEAFARRSVSRVSFGDLKGKPGELLEMARSRLKALDDLDAAIEDRGKRLLAHKMDLLILHDYLSAAKARDQVKENLAETGAAFVLEGWAKQRDVPALREGLASVSDTVEVFDEDPAPDDDVPVSLENHPLIAPFEVVTNIYGFPQYGEQDPTPLLAPFFFIYFGLALTDAAYGIVLALAFWFLMKKYRIPRGGRKFFVLMIYGGISTAVFGAMAGGWFGNLIDFMPESMGFLRSFRSMFFVLDPMAEPLKFMVVSLILGVVQVWFGIFVKMLAVVRSGAVRDAMYDQLPWLVLIPSLVLMAVSKAGIGASLSGVFSKMALLSALALVITQGRNTRNVIAKPFVGLYALYGGVGYFSDVLSYTRLLALGLATGVIGNVINQISVLAKMIPLLGYVIMVVILVGGHAFNLIINVLGAFIHSGRLQFVEFFTKFFEGGGKGFKPFRKDTKYVVLE